MGRTRASDSITRISVRERVYNDERACARGYNGSRERRVGLFAPRFMRFRAQQSERFAIFIMRRIEGYNLLGPFFLVAGSQTIDSLLEFLSERMFLRPSPCAHLHKYLIFKFYCGIIAAAA